MSVSTDDRCRDHKEAVWRVVEEGFNANRPDIADELCTADFVNTMSMVAVPLGPRALADHIRTARDRISEFRLRIVDLVGEGDEVAVTWQTWGSSGGYFGGQASPQTSAWLIGFFSFEDAGLTRWEGNWEPVRLLSQTGVLTVPETRRDPGRPVRPMTADLAALGDIAQLRASRYSSYATFGEAVEVRPADGPRRREVCSAAEALLRYGFGFTDSLPRPSVADDAYLSFADMPDGRGHAGILQRHDRWSAAFEPVDLHVERALVEDDRFALRWRLSVRHRGTFAGLEPTGRRITVCGSSSGRLDGGAVTQWIELVDLMALLRELGGLSVLLPGCLPAS